MSSGRLSSVASATGLARVSETDAAQDSGALEVSPEAAAGMLGAQHLQAVLNDRALADDWAPLMDTLAGFLGLSSDGAPVVPPLAPGVLPEVTAADFERYLRSLASSWPAFVAAREASRAQRATASSRAADAATGAWGAPLCLACASVVLCGSRCLAALRVLDALHGRVSCVPAALIAQPHTPEAASAAGLSLVQARAARACTSRTARMRHPRPVGGSTASAGALPQPKGLACALAAAQAMQEVPVIFFARDFDFAHPDTFAAICGNGAVPATLVRCDLSSSPLVTPALSSAPRPPRSRLCCRSG